MVVCINICGISGALGRFGWVKNCTSCVILQDFLFTEPGICHWWSFSSLESATLQVQMELDQKSDDSGLFVSPTQFSVSITRKAHSSPAPQSNSVPTMIWHKVCTNHPHTPQAEFKEKRVCS